MNVPDVSRRPKTDRSRGPEFTEVAMNSISNITAADQTPDWQADTTPIVVQKTSCFTELSTIGLMGGAVVLSGALWLAIIAVL